MKIRNRKSAGDNKKTYKIFYQMNNIFNRIISFTFFLFVSLALFSQEKADFDTYIANSVKNFELPGLAIAVVKDGEVVFEKAYGVTNQESGEEMETEDVFAIASLSKAFTAAAIGMLVDEGKLQWNDRVRKYIKGFDLSDEYVASQLTIKDLLSHRSGFNTFDGDLLWYGTTYSREEIIDRFSRYKMSYDLRSEYGYQNIMFIIAGEVVEEVSGMSWEEFIRQRIFEPLDMDNSYATFAGFEGEDDKALPHVKGELDAIRNYDKSGGAAAISSNVEDLSHWIQMWLNKGVYDEDTLLQLKTWQTILDMHTPITPSTFDRSNNVEFKGYGLGWFLMSYEGHKVAYHGGGLPGYISKIFIIPAENLGGVILSNGETSLPSALMYRSIDEFLGREDKPDWAATYLGFKNHYEKYLEKKDTERTEKRDAKTKANIKEEALTGRYTDVFYGDARINKMDGKLHLSLEPAKETFSSEMTHWQQNTYRIKFKDQFLPQGFVTFSANADGEVQGFTIDLPNPDFHFHNLDFRKVE
jgi:CubicO group peptidase (beta-lactamase class C family)